MSGEAEIGLKPVNLRAVFFSENLGQSAGLLGSIMNSLDVFEITRGTLAGAVLKAVGLRFRGIALTESGVLLIARKPREVPFIELASSLRMERVLGFTAVSVPLHDGSELKVAGLKRADVVRFINNANEAWRRSISELFNHAREDLDELAEVVERLEIPRRYPSACLLQPYQKLADALVERLPKVAPEDLVSLERRKVWNAILDFQKGPEKARTAAIKTFIDRELESMKGFFDTIESNPLTPEQRLAVVTDEDATLVLAGAGSGKTSVIVAKAAYLIHRAIRRPEEILLMAFGNDAAEEMAGRIKDLCGTRVDALTFHALGYAIIRAAEGQAPALAPHASDDLQFRALLRDILIKDIAPKEKLRALLLRWFSEFYEPYKSQWDFKTKHEYYQYVEAHELRTLGGNLVRSFEELEIANWLYLNGIAYEYEPIYEHKLPENERTAYTPDFRLTESGVYIEHFGIRKSSGPNGEIRFTTASFVDRTSYLEGIDWKRKVHQDNGTTLIETYSYERVEGRLIEALREKISPYTNPSPISSEKMFEALSEMGCVDAFTQTLSTFLRHFKSSRLTIDRCRARAEEYEDTARSLAFLKIFEPVFEAYELRLGERIDFEDMILRAADHVQAGRYQSSYRHLLVDEFQDISDGRAHLLRALKSQHPDARIFAVGDDWQSIYRFAGSDIHLMRHFGREFGGTIAGLSGIHSTVDLGRTFRSVDKLAHPARNFILKNPSQIDKKVITVATTESPAIKVAYYTQAQESASLNVALERIQDGEARIGKTSVLLLGRYRFVRPGNLDEIRSRYPNLSITFKTLHASKGTEADHVIIFRASSGRMGFPSEIVDDPLLDLVLPEREHFAHAEERRLFYVALTRARRSVTVLADRERPSTFVREIIENEEYQAVQLGGLGVAEHQCGTCGGRMLPRQLSSGRLTFACEHRFLCGETLRSCPVCDCDLPVKKSLSAAALICSCGAQFPACPDCNYGWFVERKGRYGTFFGCVRFPSCRGSK